MFSAVVVDEEEDKTFERFKFVAAGNDNGVNDRFTAKSSLSNFPQQETRKFYSIAATQSSSVSFSQQTNRNEIKDEQRNE